MQKPSFEFENKILNSNSNLNRDAETKLRIQVRIRIRKRNLKFEVGCQITSWKLSFALEFK